MDSLIEKYLGEVGGRGMGQQVDIKKKDEKKILALLKQLKIKYNKDDKGNYWIGDDDIDQAEEMVARKLNILI